MTNLYKPDPTEPSIFGPVRGGITADWMCWWWHNLERPIKTANYPVSAVIINKASMHMEFNPLLALRGIRHLIKVTKTTDLQKVPPAMFLENISSKPISLLWLIDTCVRDDMTPEEATFLAIGFMKD